MWPDLPHVEIEDFSRLNLQNTVLSKRKLTELVDGGKVPLATLCTNQVACIILYGTDRRNLARSSNHHAVVLQSRDQSHPEF